MFFPALNKMNDTESWASSNWDKTLPVIYQWVGDFIQATTEVQVQPTKNV